MLTLDVQEKMYTADDLLQLPHDQRHALVKGELIEMSPTGRPHGLVVAELTFLLKEFVREHKLGQVYGAETGFKLAENPDTVYGIDASFVSKPRAQKGEGYFIGAPDLVVEVASPGNTKAELHEKIINCFNVGARLIWVIYPKSRVIYVYASPDSIAVRHESDQLDGGEVLPGFSVSIGALFAVLDD